MDLNIYCNLILIARKAKNFGHSYQGCANLCNYRSLVQIEMNSIEDLNISA